MVLLDTDVVTLIEYGKSETLKTRVEAARREDDLVITVITQMERLGGRFDSLLKAANEAELLTAMTRYRDTRAALTSFRVLDVDDAAARHFERLRKDRKVKMRRADMLIACVALARGILLVSRNVKDYQQVPGLRVENWAD